MRRSDAFGFAAMSSLFVVWAAAGAMTGSYEPLLVVGILACALFTIRAHALEKRGE